ncbi:MAG: hypothetical protein H6P95_357 [Candidatus Aminicenantes bacterium]|nr:hypothetical protein [Candidatus Aminicenantes bacterium]
MPEPGRGCRLVGDRREFLISAELPSLNDLDAHRVVGLIVLGDRAVERRTVVEAGVDIAQEIGRRDGRPDDVDLDEHVALIRPDEHARIVGRSEAGQGQGQETDDGRAYLQGSGFLSEAPF